MNCSNEERFENVCRIFSETCTFLLGPSSAFLLGRSIASKAGSAMMRVPRGMLAVANVPRPFAGESLISMRCRESNYCSIDELEELWGYSFTIPCAMMYL
jgi:hypothetical protein